MQPSTLDAGRRREYLAALGLPVFLARRELPGAAISVTDTEVVPVAMPDTTPAERRPAAVTTARTASPVPSLPAAAASLPPAPAVAVTATVGPAAADRAATVAPPPRFACRLMSLGEPGFVLLDLGRFPDVVAGETLSLPPAEQQLWRNLQRALAWYPGEPEPDFIWPRAVKGMLGDDADTARDMLSAWLTRQIPAERRLWVFGEALAPFVTRPHRLLPGLSVLLASPLAKRQVWHQLSQAMATP